MNPFQSVSDTISGLIAESKKYTVRVDARKRLPTTGWVWDNTGLVLTADHGIDREDDLHVIFDGEQNVSASLVGRDPTTDTAVLRVQSTGLSAAPQSNEGLQVGQLVLAIGRPGEDVEASIGMLSAIGPAWRTAYGASIDRYLRTEVVMHPGFSGGPLLSSAGTVIGMNTSALLRNQAATIPVSTLARVVKSLVSYGKVKRGYVGIGTQPVRLSQDLSQTAGQATGLLITSIETGSPAEKAGLILGDILVRLNQHAIRTPDDLIASLSEEEIGKSAELRVIRGGQSQTLGVVLGERE